MGRYLLTDNSDTVKVVNSGSFIQKEVGQNVFGTGNFLFILESGTFELPMDIKENNLPIRVSCIGPGGHSAGYHDSKAGGGGGGFCQKVFTNPEDNYTLTIDGSQADFDGILTANAGGSAPDDDTPGIGGTATGGDVNFVGGDGSGNNSLDLDGAGGGNGICTYLHPLRIPPHAEGGVGGGIFAQVQATSGSNNRFGKINEWGYLETGTSLWGGHPIYPSNCPFDPNYYIKHGVSQDGSFFKLPIISDSEVAAPGVPGGLAIHDGAHLETVKPGLFCGAGVMAGARDEYDAGLGGGALGAAPGAGAIFIEW